MKTFLPCTWTNQIHYYSIIHWKNMYAQMNRMRINNMQSCNFFHFLFVCCNFARAVTEISNQSNKSSIRLIGSSEKGWNQTFRAFYFYNLIKFSKWLIFNFFLRNRFPKVWSLKQCNLFHLFFGIFFSLMVLRWKHFDRLNLNLIEKKNLPRSLQV